MALGITGTRVRAFGAFKIKDSIFKRTRVIGAFPSAGIDFLAMADAKDENFIVLQLEYDAIIADSKFPVALEGFPQGFSIFLRGNQKPGFDGLSNPVADICVELRDIPCLDVPVVE